VASKNPHRFLTADCAAANIRCPCTAGQKKHAAAGTKRITLEASRKVLGVESVKDAAGKV
jgi:hypothetical protein